ncbi:hypothetical protein QTP88_010526 [Uroleucon formosanum]
MNFSKKFENFCRMSYEDFEYLLNKIGPSISKMDTNMRKCIPIQEKLAVTLRFLASGDSFVSLSYMFKFSPQAVSRCVQEVCRALVQELKDEIKLPQTTDEWLKIAHDFNERWNFPHCLGAIDGKHIVIQCPINSGTEFFNYKGTFSIVLMALVDANYMFTYVDIGCQGRISDGGVFKNTSLWHKLEANEILLPSDEPLPSKTDLMPYVFIGDGAFSLGKNMMKPYTGVYEKGSIKRIFNYRLSRARRIVENAFGIMSSVFRVFRKPILLNEQKAADITMTCVLLHNFLRKSKTSKTSYSPPGAFDSDKESEFCPGSWRNDQEDMSSFIPLRRVPRRSGLEAMRVRDLFAEYFISNGAVTWQNDK